MGDIGIIIELFWKVFIRPLPKGGLFKVCPFFMFRFWIWIQSSCRNHFIMYTCHSVFTTQTAVWLQQAVCGFVVRWVMIMSHCQAKCLGSDYWCWAQRKKLHRLSVVLLFWKRLLYTNRGADPTFASAKVKNAIGRIGIFPLYICSESIVSDWHTDVLINLQVSLAVQPYMTCLCPTLEGFLRLKLLRSSWQLHQVYDARCVKFHASQGHGRKSAICKVLYRRQFICDGISLPWFGG